MSPQQEEVIERFENSWRSGRRPAIGAVLCEAAGARTDSEQRELAIELVKVDLEYRWRAAQARGRRTALKLEAYAGRLRVLGPAAQLPLDLIAEEYRFRRRFGDAPQLQEYFARFVHPRAELARALEAVDRELAQEDLPIASPAGPAPRRIPHAVDPQAPLYYGDFVLKRQIGSGGLCRVYAGLQLSLQKEVALKVLRRQFWTSVAAVAAFLREAQIVAQLPAVGIVGIHGLGRLPRGGYFMVMDLVDGLDLRARRSAAEVSPGRAAAWIAAAAGIVGRVHAAGFVHGDLKPANILVEHGGRVLLTDFGFARGLGAADSPRREGLLGGTPAFLAPELAADAHPPATAAIDVFGLGAVLFWLLSGRAIHKEEGLGELQRSLSAPGWEAQVRQRMPAFVPSGLVDLCRRCLARHPDNRPGIEELAFQCRAAATSDAAGA
jgi:hypothetical protein